MKQKLIVFSTGLTILSAVAFMGCSQEDGMLTGDDLSINSQVPKRRAPSEQIINPNPNEFNYEENECCLVALVEAKQQKMFEHTFTAEKTAQNFYNDVKGNALSKKDEDGNPRYTGGFMDLDLFTELGREYKIISERKTFTNAAEKREFFSDKKNKPTMMKIDVLLDKETGKTAPHVAHIKSIDRSKNTVTYKISGDEKTISIDDVKDVWM